MTENRDGEAADRWPTKLPICASSFTVIWLGALLVLAIILYPAVVLIGVGYRGGSHPELLFADTAYARKEASATASSTIPRLFLVGGSSTYWSIRADLLAAATDRPCLNFGVHAGLGQEYCARRAARSVRAGDRVLLIPEHSVYRPEPVAPLTGRLRQMVLTYDRWYLVDIGPWWAYATLYSVPLDDFKNAGRNLRSLLGWRRPDRPRDHIVEGTASTGDLLVNGAFAPFAPLPDDCIDDTSLDHPDWGRPLFDAVDQLQAEGTEVMVTWPMLAARPAFVQRLERIDGELRRRFADRRVPILEHPADLVAPAGLMTNTPLHGTLYAAVERTWHLLEHLPRSCFVEAQPIEVQTAPLLLLSWASADVQGSIAAWHSGVRQARRILHEPGPTTMTITWDAVTQAVSYGRKVLTDDPSLRLDAAQHGMVLRRLGLAEPDPPTTLDEIATRFPAHLMLVSAHDAAPGHLVNLHAWSGASIIGTAGAAIFGTGRYAGIVTGSPRPDSKGWLTCEQELDLELITGRSLPLQLRTWASPGGGGVSINDTPLSRRDLAPGVEVVVLDPGTGTIAGRAFLGDEVGMTSLYQVEPAIALSPTVPAIRVSLATITATGNGQVTGSPDKIHLSLHQDGRCEVALPTNLTTGNWSLELSIRNGSRAWLWTGLVDGGNAVLLEGPAHQVPVFATPHRLVVPFVVRYPMNTMQTIPRIVLWQRARTRTDFTIDAVRLHRIAGMP